MRRRARPPDRRRWAGWIAALALAALSTPASAEETIIAHRCLTIAGGGEAALEFAAPAGFLRVAVAERGISATATLDQDATSTGASPVERLGTIVLTSRTTRPANHVLTLRGQDSPQISAPVCISAMLLSAAEPLRRQAERDLATAGHAVQTSDWEAAFSAYLDAARRFDRLARGEDAALARHAMAELAYRRFDRKRDAYALASEALAGYMRSNRLTVGLLAELQAKTLLDMPGRDLRVVAPIVRERLAVARRLEQASPASARELPRVAILSGFLEFLLDEHQRAGASFAQAARSCRHMQDWDCYATAMQNLANLAEENKNYAVALSTYAEALRLLPPALNPKLVAEIWNNLGRLQGVVGLFSSSEHSLTAAVRAYARLGDCQGVRRSLARVGNLLVHVGNLADAEGYLERAASLDCRDLLATADISPPLGLIRAASLDGGKTQRSPTGTTEAWRNQLCAQPLDPGALALENKIIVFNSLLSLGNAVLLEGESAQVERCLQAARPFAADSRSQIRLANALGAALLERNDPAGARSAFEQALRIADSAGLPATYEHRGEAQLGLVESMLLAGKTREGLQESYAALESNIARGDIDRTVTSLRLIAAGYRGTGNTDAAARTLEVAADLIEAVPIDELDGEQRATFLATQHTVFTELTDLFAAESGSTDDAASWLAFESSERGRSRSLRYALNQSTRDASAATEGPPVAKYQRLLADVVQLTAAPGTRLSQSRLIDEIERAAVRERTVAESLDREQLTRTLEQLDATLVEYASGPREMFAFILEAGRVHVLNLGDRRQIAAAAEELRVRLRDTETPAAEVQAAARRLAQRVLWPITAFLPRERIVFVPDGALHTIPLAVLPWSAHSSELVLQHAQTTVIPSALFLTHARSMGRGHTEAPRIELVGDPVFRVADWRRECVDTDTSRSRPTRSTRAISDWTESLPPLPGSRAEVAAIARLTHDSLPASRTEILVGCAAVPTALRKAANADIDLLHIATHARIDAQRPRLSALALTPEPGTNGTAAAFGLLDILGLKLKSKLVVLSACETSRGRLLPGEGVLGPAQAFLQAGSAAVLASYWRVDDQITSTFMQRFYRHLLIDRLSASAALRSAQLDLASTGTSFEWAAFALYGWPDSAL